MSGGRRLKGAYGALNGVYWMLCCLVYSFSANFLLGRGYSNSALGAIVAAGYILGIALQAPAAALADKTVRAPLAVLGGAAALVGATAAVVWALPGKSAALTAAYVLFSALVIMLQPLVNAFAYYIEGLGTAVPFGVCRAVGSLAYGVLAAVLGRVILGVGVNAVPGAGLITAALMVLLMAWFSRAGTPARAERADETGAGGRLWKNGSFRALLLAAVLLFFSHSFLSGYTIQIVRAVGGDDGDMGMLTMYIAVLELPTMFLFDRLLRRFSCGGLLRFAAVFFAVKSLLVFASGSLGGVYGAMTFQLLGYALYIPASVRYAGQISGPGDANRAQACVTAMSTLGSVCASGFGGVLIDVLGVRAALGVTALAAVLGALVMVLGVKDNEMAKPGA